MSQSRQLAAIMFTDIVGYTSLMQQDEMRAVSAVRRYLSVLNLLVPAHSGMIINDYGDGSLCTFPSAKDAIQCAVDIQVELRNEPSVPLRIGLHIGEIFFENGKVFGDGVNIASRIQSIGQENTILFSEEIHSKIKNQSEFGSVSLGRFEFKNVDGSCQVFALTNAGLNIPSRQGMSGKLMEAKGSISKRQKVLAATVVILILVAGLIYKTSTGTKVIAEEDKTIAVLPFKNISTNKEENEPFCIGVVLELQRKLEWLGGLMPVASQSVEKYRDTRMSITEIASELGGIRYILQGAVQRDKNRIKVFASLINAQTGKEIWSNDYPGEVEDIFSLQEDIAQQIAEALQVKITPAEQNRMNRVATRSAAAIDAYNEALTSYVKLISIVHPLYWDSLPSNHQTYTQYLKTLSLCNKAIKTDPMMAEAYVLKGQTYLFSTNGWNQSKSKKKLIRDSATWLGRKALQIDQSSADGYLLMAMSVPSRDSTLGFLENALVINTNSFEVNRQACSFFAGDDPLRAIQYGKKAVRLNPLSVWIPLVYGNIGYAYHDFGDFEKAEWYGKKAVELTSNSMIAVEASRNLAVIYLHWGKGDSVIKYANRYMKQDTSLETNALYEIAEVYCNLKNDCSRASQLYEELWTRYPNHSNQHRWAVALKKIGKTNEANKMLERAMIEHREKADTLSYDYAGICAMRGDKTRAMEILRKFDWPWGSVYLIQHDKLFDNLRNEQEFQGLVKKALDDKTTLREKVRKMEANATL